MNVCGITMYAIWVKHWDKEIKSDVEAECEKYGQIEHLHVDQDSQVSKFQSLSLSSISIEQS